MKNPLPSPAGEPDAVTARVIDQIRAGKTFEQIFRDNPDIRGADLHRARKYILAMIFESRPETILRELNRDAGRTLPQTAPATEDPAFAHADAAYYLTISLDHVKPEIWRNVIVPGHIRLDLLHDVIQIAMGWQDMHLHIFDIDGRRFSENPEEDFEGDEEHHYRLDALVHAADRSFAYEYDMGDGWHHTIVVQKIVPFEENTTAFPSCVGGKHACPPEDCGGPYAYVEMLKERRSVRPKKATRNTNRNASWARFDIEQVNLELAKHWRWSRHRWGAPVFGAM